LQFACLLCWQSVEVIPLGTERNAILVVLDVSASEGASWRVAHAIQETPALADTAVLLLPYLPAPHGDRARGLDLGWVSLVPKPFTAQQLTHAVERAAAGTAGESDVQHDVLIVDDDEDSRRVASQFLIDAGARVREARDGESALSDMRRRPPDVVVLDLMMPVLDGFGVLATMRADPLLAVVPVVVLSAKSLTEPERRFLARTAARVLQKGEHRLGDVAALVLRAAAGAARMARG
jgi:CheY-like chemotaxis protein